MNTTTAPQATIYDTWNTQGIAFEDTATYRLVSTLATEVSDKLDTSTVIIRYDMSDEEFDAALTSEKALKSEWAALAGFRTLGVYNLLAQVVA